MCYQLDNSNCLPWNQYCDLLKAGSMSSTLAHPGSTGEDIWALTSYYVYFVFNISIKCQLVFIQKAIKGFACQCVFFYFNLNLLVKVLIFAMLCSFSVMARIIKSQENPEGKQSNKAVLCFVAGMIIQTEVQSKNHAFLNAVGKWVDEYPASFLPPCHSNKKRICI